MANPKPVRGYDVSVIEARKFLGAQRGESIQAAAKRMKSERDEFRRHLGLMLEVVGDEAPCATLLARKYYEEHA